MFKRIKEFFKNLFCKETEVEIPVASGETPIVIETSGESGTTIVAVSGDIDTPPVTVESGFKSTIKILIDNGHGNDTAGKRSPYCATGAEPEIEFYEYKWNREIAKPVVDGLIKEGYDAELLVPEENDISLAERVRRVNAICNELGKKKVLLISIHSNAAGTGQAWMTGKGWSVYTTKGKTDSDILAEYLYVEAKKNFSNRKIRVDLSDDDNDWEADFYILKKTLCPAVLTENFFYDNVDDVKYILSDEGRAAVIKTHIDGIINYIKSL